MPTLHDITVTVHTPFALEGVPEFAPSSNNNVAKPINVLDQKKSTVSVYIPLLINREVITTWCCDNEEQWKGKVQFGLFDTSKDAKMVGGAGMRKETFRFGETDFRVIGNLSRDGDEDRVVEVKVYRANLKIRVPRKMEAPGQIQAGNGISLQPAGNTKRGHPRKYYNFGLIDALEAPYAVFRFFYRTWEEIDALNLRIGQVDNKEAASVFVEKPGSNSPTQKTTTSSTNPNSGSIRVAPPPPQKSTPKMPSPYVPPIPATPAMSIPRMPGQVNLRRLSIPPTTVLRPSTEHRPLPASPTKTRTPVNSPDSAKETASAEVKRRDGASGVLRSLVHGALSKKA